MNEARGREVFHAGEFGGLLGSSADNGVFRLCFNCKTCTSSCPIVGLTDMSELDLVPHQIVHATALGLDELVASARMLWACLGCYRCQDKLSAGRAGDGCALCPQKQGPGPHERRTSRERGLTWLTRCSDAALRQNISLNSI